MSKQMTAVEWLFSQLPDHLRLSRDGFENLQYAKQLDKEQKTNAFKAGADLGGYYVTDEAKQYYNDKYGSDV